MATSLINKIDSNSVGLSIAEEECPKTLPTTPVWILQEPNSFSDFGGTVNTKARNPINPSRQRKKGSVVGFDATGGYTSDLTQTNLQNLIQGFMFADMRRKDELDVTIIDTNSFQPVAGGDGFVSGDILFSKGFSDSANNGVFNITGIPAAANIDVLETLVDTTAENGTVSRIGYTFADGDCDIDVTGTLPAIVSTVKDLTTLGLIVGEFVYIGSDDVGEKFAGDTNNGFCRVRTISTNRIEFDKTQFTMVDEDSTGLTIKLFFGRVIKNETGSLIKRRTYQLERTLGAPDANNLSQLQAEYIIGAAPNELTFNIALEDIATFDASFVGLDSEQQTSTVPLKAGDRPNLIESDAFNTSSDVSITKIAKVVEGDASPEPLYAFAEDISISINNNITPNKAIGVLGAFETTTGTFEVSGDIGAYFADISAVQAVRDNADVTLEIHLVKENSGVTIDLPLITLGDGKPNVEQDQSIKLPLSTQAATGAKIDSNLDHTMLMVFWDYLPNQAG